MPSFTRIILDSWLIPQLHEILMAKMNKGDIQAEFDLSNQIEKAVIRINMKQLFIIIQALIHFKTVVLEETCYTESKEDNPFTRKVLLTKEDGTILKDLTNIGPTQQDLMIRDQAKVVEKAWNKE